ncbi:uncharacterized protein [Physcomitrium patens]|uniref:USP domain-containing protein n=2 Tax=Physcomitrium patens TaxID=3218 RepID=A0A2K1IAJ4_PHYPA|nr:uncharacterized protein LOC112278477 isoform X2 [Physcomitrium patens]PNR26302.1 hypothetical protein PHYPA_030876 [Physcomitrium patens]|eukprot:XP_024367798.1 uncharacterized protein LOC112278477 isoform X2 [Physcomitrella patens]
MAQKKKASASRTATVNVPVSPAPLENAPVWFISTSPYVADSRGAVAVPESHAGTVAEVFLSANEGGGGQRKRDATDPGNGGATGKCLGKGGSPAVLSNGIGKVLPVVRWGGSSVTSGDTDESASAALVKRECEKALVALRRGNSTKALKLMRDVCSRNEASGIAHRVHGHIFMRQAAVIEDSRTKQKHFQSALESARKAASLSPQSVEYAHFYAQLLYEAAKDSKGYEDVVQECERALRIDDPVDPAREDLHHEQQQELLTAEARIAHVHQELRSLMQKANLTSISTWMKTLGSGMGEEKLRFVQMRKFANQDPMEQRVSLPKRPHEVKKVVKTPEERRKEIELRVAAARLLQQRDSSADGGIDYPEDHEKSLQKKLERRKSSGLNSRKISKPLSIDERIDRVRQFWYDLTPEKRESMLEVSIAKLKDHLASWKVGGGLVKSHAASDALSEALEFAQEYKTWRFWACCKCGERFVSYHDLSHHTLEKHMPTLPQELQQMIPQEFDQEWMDQLLDEDCRPIDGVAAVKLLIKCACSFLSDDLQAAETTVIECEDSKFSQKSTDKVINAKSVEDAKEVSLETFKDIEAGPDQGASGVGQEYMRACKGDCRNGMQIGRTAKVDVPSQDLPLVDDEARKKLLEKIHGLFKVLIKNKCLTRDYVSKIIEYSTEEIQSLFSSPARHDEFNPSPLYIRFLELKPLQHVYNYLVELAQACGVNRYSENTVHRGNGEGGEEETIEDRMFPNEDFTNLLLDERVLKEFPKELLSPTDALEHRGPKEFVVEKDAVSHRQRLPLMKGNNGELSTKHMDRQLSWIFGTTGYEYQPSGWKQFREEQGRSGRDVCRAYENDFANLLDLCKQKYELVSDEDALNLVKRSCLEENKRREYQPDGSVSRSSDGSLGVRVSDWDGYETSAWKTQEFVQCADRRADAYSLVDAARIRQRGKLSNKVNHLDAKIMRATDDLLKKEIKLGQLAVLNYRAVVLPLVKSLLQTRLETEAERDAQQKLDAVQEALLAELAKDQKSSAPKEVEHQKQVRGKSKDKKKVKDKKKFKDAKRGSTNSEPQDETPSVDLDEDKGDNWDWVVRDDLNQQREFEIQHQALLFEEERKLMEALELQRRVEDEAKQKHLAEQERKKKIAKQAMKVLEKEAVGTFPFTSESVDVVSSTMLPTSSTLLLLAQNGHQHLTEMADPVNFQLVLPTVVAHSSGGTSHSPALSAWKMQPVPDQNVPQISGNMNGSADFDLEVTEQQLVKDESNKTLEKAGFAGHTPLAGSNTLLSGDGEHSNAVQKKPRNGSRNRRRKGPRIYAEEGIVGDQDTQSCNAHESVNGPKTLLRQKIPKEHGGILTIDNSKSFLRQNATRSYGAAPTNGLHPVQPLLLLPAPASEAAGEHEGKKSLRQLQAEQDDEERFQADLEQAMRQSLDMLTSQSAASVVPNHVPSSPIHTVRSNGTSGDHRAQQLLETGIIGPITGVVETSSKEIEEFGKGLRNEIGQYNCFLNVVIQSLWHLRRFREELLADTSTQHVHIGSPCVVCALRDIFLGLDAPIHNSSSRDAVAPIALRVALSALYPDSDLFKQGQMNDASEVLGVIFECLHKAFVPNATSVGNSESSITRGSWDCYEEFPCMAHALFGLQVAEQMNCQGCHLESRHFKYTTFFHHINASALRSAKALYEESSMDDLLKLVDMNDQLTCDRTDDGGCGRQNHMHHFLQAAPHVFTTVLGWQNGRESFEDISATVDAIDVALDVGVIYCGLDKGFQHRLVSVVCYYGLHYHCFAYNQELGRWVMFDDSTVKVIGEWKDVASTCRRGHLQPQVLFYETVAARSEAMSVTVCQ